MREIIIEKKDAMQRLDKLMLKVLNKAPASFVYKMLRKKNIVLNDKKAEGKELLSEGDSVKIYLSDETIDKFTSKRNADISGNIPLPSVVYEDDNLIIADKSAGILSQKAGDNDISMNEICLEYMLRNGQITEDDLKLYRPSVVNRLDRNTTGLIIFAKNYMSASELSKALKDRRIHKYYYCIVKGALFKEETIEGYLAKDEITNKVTVTEAESGGSSYIKTHVIPKYTQDDCSLLEIELITGKTHQIRAHLSSIGHPIIGDLKYGDGRLNEKYKKEFKVRHQLLHSHRVVFGDLQGGLSYLSGKIIDAPTPRVYKEIMNVNLE